MKLLYFQCYGKNTVYSLKLFQEADRLVQTLNIHIFCWHLGATLKEFSEERGKKPGDSLVTSKRNL